ncbi:ABA 3 protein [Talaromyces proteolyticus]|uniref:ABA 3 protein n=1 Tax=Talaromyces proteolyticus TaxID=1131652 RepID=A0AAD4KG93_9EURO|nr:ABA 3 protein [Talaromyces proteolyticus]KAH8688781.1 ABA 3 protein [Talaromyces proteolyticus]
MDIDSISSIPAQTQLALSQIQLNADMARRSTSPVPHDLQSLPTSTKETQDLWYYPPDIAHDLDNIDLPERFKEEVYACAWEYSRCVIPYYSNWRRYVAFMRTIVIGIVAEFRGDLVDVTASNNVLNYDLDDLLSTLLGDSPGGVEIAREFRTFCLMTSTKTGSNRNCELFKRYMNVLTASPKLWFRLRDCDSLARFTLVVALRCNDLDIWFSNEQFEILAEIGDILYDAIAYHKHRSEGETHSTFQYVPNDMRVEAFRYYREVLWAFDTAWAGQPELAHVTNFLRAFGGPIHMTMRRYRFVEDSLGICQPETAEVINKARQNSKLWCRIEARRSVDDDVEGYRSLLISDDKVLFTGLAELLETYGNYRCTRCQYPKSYGVQSPHEFGGVKLCDECVATWREYVMSFPTRLSKAFPEVGFKTTS